MDEREEILTQLKAIRAVVATFAAHTPFDLKTSQYLDWLDQRIEHMEGEK